MAKLIEAILNPLVTGIPKFGCTCGKSVGVFGCTWLLLSSSIWEFVPELFISLYLFNVQFLLRSLTWFNYLSFLLAQVIGPHRGKGLRTRKWS